MKKKMVLITWIDAQCIDMGGTFKVSSIKDMKPMKAYIVGFVIKVDKDNYYLAQENWGNDYYKYLHIIPKRSIVDVRVVEDRRE